MYDRTITHLRAMIRTLAAEGRTWECDVLHGKIATLEEANAIVLGEDEAIEDITKGLDNDFCDIPSDAAHHNH